MKLKSKSSQIAVDAMIAENVQIECEDLVIESGVVIEEDVVIKAKNAFIGYKTVIQKRCTISGIGQPAESIKLGDYGLVGHDTEILVPIFETGDYTAIHNHALVSGYKPCWIGHNSFIGQHSVLNSSEILFIGNNFRMALNGYIWTHAESGELLEGCNFYHRTPTIIEDNVWLAGCNTTISPGVRLRNGSIALMGSVITKDTIERHCYGGSPARDLTEKLQPYRQLSAEEKNTMFKGFISEFEESFGSEYENKIEILASPESKLLNNDAKIVIIEQGAPIPFGIDVSVFSLSDKTYIKQRTNIEEKFIRFLVGARARFVPVNHTRIGIMPLN